MRSHKLGHEGEAFAADFLRRQGYVLIEHNFRCKAGEIDLIAQDGETICFIEVKTRMDEGWDAFEAVDRRKQAKMRRAAQFFLIGRFGTEDIPSRFDVLAVRALADGQLEGELLKDAFGI